MHLSIEVKFMRNLLFVLLLISSSLIAQNGVTVNGYVNDENGEALIYASILIEGESSGTTTNEYGFFSITAPDSNAVIVISYMGYNNFMIDVDKDDLSNLKFKMIPYSEEIGEVELSYEKGQQEEKHNSTQMSSIQIPVKQIKHMPSLGGEVDVIKVMQLMPGVQGGGEGGTDMFVRGGDADQNLVILDEATVYNVGHLFGFFSVFNPDAIHDMTMIKGAFPANHGGRLSSVLDIRMKEGADNQIHGSGGIGLLSSRLTLEGPVTEKSTFMISGRRTYIDQVFRLATKFTVPYYFYDLNAKFNYQISDKDRLFISGYYGNDVLRFSEETGEGEAKDSTDTGGKDSSDEEGGGLFNFGFTLGNYTTTARWNRIINDKTFSNVSLIYTNFKYDIRGSFTENSLLIKSKIQDIGLKWNMDYYHSSRLRVKYGLSSVNHGFRPNVISTTGELTDFLASREGNLMNALESAVYGLVEYDYNTRLRINTGLRVSSSAVEGRFYAGLEPRLAARYKLNENNVFKASYSRMNQYMHRVSSSTVALPTDLWYPVTANVRPQSSDQIAIGFSQLYSKISSTLTLEAYYKWMNNLTEYRQGANLILNDQFENDLLQGYGRAWGAELMFRKDRGKITGWLAYSLSFANRTFDELNNGNTFWAKYDRRHNVSFVFNCELSKKWNFSAVWVYTTGARFTPIVGQYLMPDASYSQVDIIPIYAERNSVQMSASHRLDINFVRKSIKDKRFKSEWHFGAYNLYNQATPYRINVEATESGYRYVQPGLFGFIPSIAYNFKF